MPLVPVADIDSILFVTTVEGTTNIAYAASGAHVPGHRVPPAALDSATTGYPVEYKMTHVGQGKDEFENGYGDLDTTTRTIARVAAQVTAGTSGAGVRHSFTAGTKHVAITMLGRSLRGATTSYQAVTAAAAQAGYQITRTSGLIRVELTEDLTAAATFALPVSPQNGDEVLVSREAGGFFDWTATGLGLKLGYRGDKALFIRVSGAWRTFRLPGRERARRESVGRTVDIDDGGGVIAATAGGTWTIPNNVGESTGFRLKLVQRSATPVTLALGGTLTKVPAGGPLTTDGDCSALLAEAIGNSQVQVSYVPAQGITAAERATLATLDVDVGGTFTPVIDLAVNRNYANWDQLIDGGGGPINFTLAAVTKTNGATIEVLITGNGDPITYSADFAGYDGSALTAPPYSGFTGTKRFAVRWDEPTGKALVILTGTAGAGTWGSIGGTLSAQTDLQAALDGKQADLAVPTQAEAEAGTATTERVWTAQRVKQAAVAASPPQVLPSVTDNEGKYLRVRTVAPITPEWATVPPGAFIDTTPYGGGWTDEFPRSLRDRDRDVINIKNFGTIVYGSTGITGSNRSANLLVVNKAIAAYNNSLTANELYFPPGNFEVDGPFDPIPGKSTAASIIMDGRVTRVGPGMVGVNWEIGSGDATVGAYYRLRLRAASNDLWGTAAAENNADAIGVRFLHHTACFIDLIDVQGWNIGAQLASVDTTGSTGCYVRFGEMRRCRVGFELVDMGPTGTQDGWHSGHILMGGWFTATTNIANPPSGGFPNVAGIRFRSHSGGEGPMQGITCIGHTFDHGLGSNHSRIDGFAVLHKSVRIFASNIYIEGTKCGIFSETATPITAEFNKISFWDSASVLSERADPTALPGDPTFTGEIRAYDVERGYELFETSTTLAPTQRHLRHLVHYTGGAANWVMNRMTCAGSIYVENRSSSAISFTDGTATRFGSTTQIPGLASGEIRYFDRGLKYKVLSFG